MSQRQCLPLDEDEDDQSTDSEMDYDVSQLSALKYLKKVRAERRKIPEIVSTTIPAKYEVTSSSNDIDLRIRERIFNENDPTKEWQQLQSEKFTILQERIVELKKDPALTEKVVGELPVDTSDEEECLKYCEENEPVLSVLLAMNQGHLEQLSEVLATYLAENADETEFLEKVKQSNAAWITKWIYSTLACLCTPLDPEVHNSLRVIAKACIQITDFLKSLPDTSDFLVFLPYNLLLVIIARNFHQFDLLSL